jgi:hypothetical protein
MGRRAKRPATAPSPPTSKRYGINGKILKFVHDEATGHHPDRIAIDLHLDEALGLNCAGYADILMALSADRPANAPASRAKP